jgi:hypothetical protein
MTALCEGVASNSCRESARPGDLARDVGDRRSDRLIASRLDDYVLVTPMRQRLSESPEVDPDECAIGPKHQRGGQPSAIGDAAGRGQKRLGRMGGNHICCVSALNLEPTPLSLQVADARRELPTFLNFRRRIIVSLRFFTKPVGTSAAYGHVGRGHDFAPNHTQRESICSGGCIVRS